MVAAAIGIPVSIVFLFLAIRGTDLGAVWSTLQGVRPLPLLGAVACMGVVYWLQAARWRRIADTRLTQRRFVEMVVAGVAVNNVLPGRVGDFSARAGCRAARTRTVGASRPSCSTAASTSWRSSRFLLVSLPFVTDEGWVDRIVVGSVLVLAVLAVLLAAARSYTRRRPRSRRTHRGLPRRFLRDTLEGLSDPLSAERGLVWFGMSVAAWGAWALGAILVGRAVGVELTLVDAIFVTAALNLGVAIPSSPGFVGTYQWLGVSALALFGDRPRGGARVRDLHAGRLVRPDHDRRRGDPRRARQGRVADGADLRLRVAALALTRRWWWWLSGSKSDTGRRGGAQSSPSGRWIRPSW